MKKNILLLLLLVLILSSCKQQEPVISKATAENITLSQVKLNNKEKDNSVYSAENVMVSPNEDNSETLYVFSAPIESSGNKIEPLKDGFYQGNGAFISKSFPEKLSSDNGINISYSSNFATIIPFEKGQYISEQKELINAFGQQRAAVIYKDVFGKGVDYTCYLTSFGINSEIVLHKKSDENTFQIKLKLPDLVPDTGSPDYILFKTALEKGEVKSILYTPLAVDKSGKWSYKNTVKLIEKDSETNTYTVEYIIDEDFLQSKSTKYPVTLNQSIHLYKSKQPDTSAYSGTGDDPGHYLSPYMLLGDKTIKGEGWTFVRYETLENLDIPNDKIVSAKYIFRNLFDLNKTAEIGAYAVTADWCSINTRWFNRPMFDEKSVAHTTIKEKGDYELDITPLFKEMIRSKGDKTAKYSVQNSFFIRSDTKDTNIILPSGDNGLFSPLLEIVVKK